MSEVPGAGVERFEIPHGVPMFYCPCGEVWTRFSARLATRLDDGWRECFRCGRQFRFAHSVTSQESGEGRTT